MKEWLGRLDAEPSEADLAAVFVMGFEGWSMREIYRGWYDNRIVSNDGNSGGNRRVYEELEGWITGALNADEPHEIRSFVPGGLGKPRTAGSD